MSWTRQKNYSREYMRKYREQRRIRKLVFEGKCPVCEILITRNPDHDTEHLNDRKPKGLST